MSYLIGQYIVHICFYIVIVIVYSLHLFVSSLVTVHIELFRQSLNTATVLIRVHNSLDLKHSSLSHSCSVHDRVISQLRLALAIKTCYKTCYKDLLEYKIHSRDNFNKLLLNSQLYARQ